MPKDPKQNRDPRAKKARDNARQRKIATNNSDKASRRNAPLIKARANRAIRRADHQFLADGDVDENADHINLAHQRKPQHWGSDNAATRRDENRARLRNFEAKGGRKAVQSQAWRDFRETTDTAAVVATINEQLRRLKKD